MQKLPNSLRVNSEKRLTFFLLLLIATICTDQYLKDLTVRLLEGKQNLTFFNEVIQFTLIENRGGFLGVVSSYPESLQFFLLYICVAILLCCCLVFIFLWKKTKNRYKVPLVLITGGGISNLLDRVLNNGGVIDFVSIGFGQIRTGIFNMADVFILSGSFLLGYRFILQDDKTELPATKV